MIKNIITRYAEDFLVLAGFVAILIGTHQISTVAAWFIGGVECLIAAFLIAWSNRTS